MLNLAYPTWNAWICWSLIMLFSPHKDEKTNKKPKKNNCPISPPPPVTDGTLPKLLESPIYLGKACL